MMMMRLPARGDGPLTILIQEPSAPHMFARSQLTMNRSTAEVLKWEPYAAASTGRKLRVWVRGLHTGEALGFIGQTVAGLASLGGCFLVWTGMAMAWRRFRFASAMLKMRRPFPTKLRQWKLARFDYPPCRRFLTRCRSNQTRTLQNDG